MKKAIYYTLILPVIFFLNGHATAQSCQADFDVIIDPNTSTIFLTDQSSSNTTITSWFWDFGDGTTSTEQNPVHTYAQNGSYTVCLTIQDANNCESSTCAFIHVDFLPSNCNAHFGFENSPGSLEVSLTDSSMSNNIITAWTWNFGDGTFSMEQNPLHLYQNEGVYNVCLTIQDDQNCVDSTCMTIQVSSSAQACLANFDVVIDPNTSTIFLTDQSTSDTTITFWFWDFGDGTTSTEQNPVHTYGQNGSYTVCLTIQDAANCESTTCAFIHVDFLPSDCNANFGFQQVPQSLEVAFTDSSTSINNLISWSWNFGDGTFSMEQNPSHIYQDEGEYNVCLTIQDDQGCVDSTCNTILVNASTPACHADFDVVIDHITSTIFLTDQSTSDSTIISWFWDFGDGTTSTQQDPEHTYAESGSYTVCLTIHNAGNCESTICALIHVGFMPGDCNAHFNFHQSPGTMEVIFADSSTTYGNIISWSWTFGDGSTSGEQNPTHIYNDAGAYEVCLIIEDDGGCQDTACHTILVDSVTQACLANFDIVIDAHTSTIFLTDQSTSDTTIVSWFWDFGDGTTSTEQNPVHTYAARGSYTVCLTIRDANDCQSTTCSLIHVDFLPGDCNADFGFHQVPGSMEVVFTDSSSANHNIISWLWTFGDGGTSNEQNPSHTYVNAGSYEVCLSVHDSLNCQNTVCDTVLVHIISGTDVLFEENDLKAYPNPFNSFVTIELDLSANSQIAIEVYDIVGTRVVSPIISNESAEIHFYEIKGEHLSPGVYLIKVSVNGEIQTQRMTRL